MNCWAAGLAVLVGLGACEQRGAECKVPFDPTAPPAVAQPSLRIHEVVSSNDGVHVDELGETDDFLELENVGTHALRLSSYVLTDSAGNRARLPDVTLAPGQIVLLWADDDLAQGDHHLPLKLSAKGEQLTLWTDPCTVVDRVDVPPLSPNESFARLADGAFARCRYATAGRKNDSCSPARTPELQEDVRFAPYTWPEGFPAIPSPLTINELALRPASFVEIVNSSREAVTLSDFTLRLAALSPAPPSPPPTQGVALPWPIATLAPGARVTVPVRADELAEIAANGEFEGWATLYDQSGRLLDRATFMAWPEGATLARMPDVRGRFRFCANGTPEAPNLCTPLDARTVGDRLHALQTAGDFAALAAGGTALGQAAVKFVVDMEAEDVVHLLGARRWPLHYTFVRERVYRQPMLDRCDPVQAASFDQGWYAFGDREYAATVGRRFLLGTLVRHANGLQTVEFASGDAIDAPLIRRAFLAAISSTDNPRAWSLRPNDGAQIAEMRKLEGTLPIVGPDAPFVGLSYQPLTHAESYGVLRFVAAAELDGAALAADTIIVTDDVPNDVPFVAAIITESFQTPLSHVNVLSQARGTPNMALRNARNDPRIAPLLGKLVRLEVGTQDFSVRSATREEVDAFWQARRPSGARIVPPSDLSLRHVVPLRERGLMDVAAVGAKAAQFAELYRIGAAASRCGPTLDFSVPAEAFAIPVAHYVDHFVASGASEQLRLAGQDPNFRSDATLRARVLEAVRAAILAHPVEPALIAEVEAAVASRYGNKRVRFRSSSNVEDLPTFNGAGLHTSTSAELDDPERSVEAALRTVWASLWSMRAYDERENANLDQNAVMMGVLVHEAFGGEAAQGVAISRDLLDVSRDDIYYLNAQRGDATVTNPAPGVTTEQILYTWQSQSYEPEVRVRSQSSLSAGLPVLTYDDIVRVACALGAVHDHFRPLLDPQQQNRAFAMQIEFKIERDGTLVVKQARPQPFGHVELPSDCR